MDVTDSAYVTSYMIVALVILLAVATVGMIAYLIYYHLVCGVFAPTRRVAAHVRLKRQRDYQVDTPSPYMIFAYGTWDLIWSIIDRAFNRDSGITIYHSWDYIITFVVNEKVVELYVPEEVYANVSEGDQGLLVYKGNHFKHFIPRALSASTK